MYMYTQKESHKKWSMKKSYSILSVFGFTEEIANKMKHEKRSFAISSSFWVSQKKSPKINSQSSEDTQVGYTSH